MSIGIRVVGTFSLEADQTRLKNLVNDLMTEVRSQVSVRTPIDTGRARRGWQKRNNVVENQVPYIVRLENGYSRQAPNGFVTQGITAAIRNVAKGK